MDAPEVGSTIATLPAWLQALVGLIVTVSSILVFVGGRLKKPSADAGKLDDEDVEGALRHMKWISRHLERSADAHERANQLAERQCAATEKLCGLLEGQPPPKPAARRRIPK